MERFSLTILFVSILLVVGWGFVDSVLKDRDGVRRKKRAEAEAQRHMAKSVRDAIRARR